MQIHNFLQVLQSALHLFGAEAESDPAPEEPRRAPRQGQRSGNRTEIDERWADENTLESALYGDTDEREAAFEKFVWAADGNAITEMMDQQDSLEESETFPRPSRIKPHKAP